MTTMIWASLAVAALTMSAVAVMGIVAAQIYLRVAYRPATRRRAVEHLVIICTGLAMFSYGVATLDCLSSGHCVAAHKRDGPRDGTAQLLR
jgi:hypothetical protein